MMLWWLSSGPRAGRVTRTHTHALLVLFTALLLGSLVGACSSDGNSDPDDDGDVVDLAEDLPEDTGLDTTDDTLEDTSNDQEADGTDVPDDVRDISTDEDATQDQVDSDTLADTDMADADMLSEVCPDPPAGLPTPMVQENGRWVEVTDFPGENGLPDRNITIYLPADYDASAMQHYPVLYLHDGQNLFDAAQAAFGVEWGVDETVDSLVSNGALTEPWIVVGIHNTAQRTSDYTPTVDSEFGGGNGDAYVDLLINRIKPWVDANYRTKCGATNTALGGSSLGGLISLHALQRYPDVFGRVAALSPSLWWNNRNLLTQWTPVSPSPRRIWLDGGGAEGSPIPDGRSTVLQNNAQLRDTLLANGLQLGSQLGYLEVPVGEHNEAAWAIRLGSVLAFLLTDEDPLAAGTPPESVEVFLYTPQLASGEVTGVTANASWPPLVLTLLPASSVTFEDGSVAALNGNEIVASGVGTTLVEASTNGMSGRALLDVTTDPSTVPLRFEMTPPAGTTEAHVSGSLPVLGNWDGVGIALSDANGLWTGEVRVPGGSIVEYKYTRGSWATVEKGPSGEELGNRSAAVTQPTIVEDEVASWAQ